MAACAPWLKTIAVAKIATIVFPEPTSPCNNLNILFSDFKSLLIWSIIFFWLLVSLKLKLELHPEIADFLKNNKKALRGLMWQNFTYISIKGNNDISRDEFRFLSSNNGQKEIEHVGIEHKKDKA